MTKFIINPDKPCTLKNPISKLKLFIIKHKLSENYENVKF